MKRIPLTQGKFALIDDEDFDLISKFKWHYRKSGRTNGKNGYAENRRGIFMHNIIMNSKKGTLDHINRNGIDNRRKNLRVVTLSQNMHNFPKKKGTKYRGIIFLTGRGKNAKKWQCSMTINGKCVYFGVYKTAKEAALVYDKKVKELYKDCAILNFPIK